MINLILKDYHERRNELIVARNQFNWAFKADDVNLACERLNDAEKNLQCAINNMIGWRVFGTQI